MAIKNNIDYWYSLVKDSSLKAKNNMPNQKTSLSINFLQIPSTDTVVMTVSIIKDNLLKVALSPEDFIRLMRIVEIGIIETRNALKGLEIEPEYYNTTPSVNYKWYTVLNCHRVFFINSEAVFLAMEKILNKTNIHSIHTAGIHNVITRVSTTNQEFTTKYEVI